MAQKQDHRTKLHQRVQIKDSVTHLYPNARVYNEGRVGRQMHDEHGYPLIYIEWDKDHWAYSGEEDRWVLEAHFNPVEDNMADEKFDDLIAGLSDLVDRYRKGTDAEPDTATDPERSEERHDDDMSYEGVLRKGEKAASQGEAFVLFVATPERHEGVELVEARIYMHSKKDDAARMLDAAIPDYVAQAMTRLVYDYLQARDDGSAR